MPKKYQRMPREYRRILWEYRRMPREYRRILWEYRRIPGECLEDIVEISEDTRRMPRGYCGNIVEISENTWRILWEYRRIPGECLEVRNFKRHKIQIFRMDSKLDNRYPSPSHGIISLARDTIDIYPDIYLPTYP